MPGKPYALENSESEFKRLEMQALIFRDLTEDVLRRAGLKTGMRVLDLGCGVGDVSFLAAELVGASGSVTGIDRSEEAVATAVARLARAGHFPQVQFSVVSDVDSYLPMEPFDAIIGRLILMYLPDPAATLRRLSAHVSPGGVLAFQEMSIGSLRSVPEGPLFNQSRNWLVGAFESAGFETDMGFRLFAAFRDAGLPPPQMIAAARVQGGTETSGHELLAQTIRSLIPTMERTGFARASDIDIDTLAQRLRTEAIENGACVMLPLLIGAWTRLPD